MAFSTKTLTDFTRCISNRVLIHDDISDKFSSVGFANNNAIIDVLTADIGNYYILIFENFFAFRSVFISEEIT